MAGFSGGGPCIGGAGGGGGGAGGDSTASNGGGGGGGHICSSSGNDVGECGGGCGSDIDCSGGRGELPMLPPGGAGYELSTELTLGEKETFRALTPKTSKGERGTVSSSSVVTVDDEDGRTRGGDNTIGDGFGATGGGIRGEVGFWR